MNVSIRQLTGNDWREFSQIRLTALLTDPQVFGSNYQKEAQNSEEDWRVRLRAKDNAIFLLSDDQTPIGVTCVSVDRDDPTQKTALF